MVLSKHSRTYGNPCVHKKHIPSASASIPLAAMGTALASLLAVERAQVGCRGAQGMMCVATLVSPEQCGMRHTAQL